VAERIANNSHQAVRRIERSPSRKDETGT